MAAIDFNQGDDLSDLLGGPASPTPRALPQDPQLARIREEKVGVVETCPKCRGTGRFTSYSGRTLGQCFACKGAGSKTYKNDAATRAANREKAQERKERQGASRWDVFAQAHAVEAAWIVEQAPRFDFAAKMRDAIEKYGDLTPGQLAAVQRGVARSEAWKAERAQKASQAAAAAQQAPALTFPNLRAAFDGLVAKGAKKAQMTFEDVNISLASMSGRNPGALYVKVKGEYAGKIVGTTFRGFNAKPELMAALAVIEADPQGAVKAQAEKTAKRLAEAQERGESISIPCGCCGIMLTDPESIRRGIGPICAGKWGF